MELHGNVELSNESDSLENTDLLMEIMEVREQLEDAQTPEELESIKQTNNREPVIKIHYPPISGFQVCRGLVLM